MRDITNAAHTFGVFTPPPAATPDHIRGGGEAAMRR